MELFKEHNGKVKALIGNGFEANTLKGYNTSEKYLTGYLQKEYGKTDIEISQLNHAFITGFDFCLKAECKISGVSAVKYIKHLKKIVNHRIANNWLEQNPFIKAVILLYEAKFFCKLTSIGLADRNFGFVNPKPVLLYFADMIYIYDE